MALHDKKAGFVEIDREFDREIDRRFKEQDNCRYLSNMSQRSFEIMMIKTSWLESIIQTSYFGIKALFKQAS